MLKIVLLLETNQQTDIERASRNGLSEDSNTSFAKSINPNAIPTSPLHFRVNEYVGELPNDVIYIKVFNCSREDKAELFQIAETFKAKVIDYGKDSLLLEFVQTATKNDAVVKLIKEEFHRIEVVRGGSVRIESISMMER